MNFKNYISICASQTSTDFEKNTTWALALTANIGNNEININDKYFMIKLLNKRKSFSYLFIESASTIIELEHESR